MAATEVLQIQRIKAERRTDAERVQKVAEDALARMKRAEEKIRRWTDLYQERLEGKVRD